MPDTASGAQKPKTSEIYPGPGFMVRQSLDRLPDALIRGFSAFDPTDVCDAMNRMYAMGSEIHNVVNARR